MFKGILDTTQMYKLEKIHTLAKYLEIGHTGNG